MLTAVFILGPPAVGKMTVGQALAGRTGFALLHNHVVSDVLSPYFHSADPPFVRLNEAITELLVHELAETYPGLIFTRTHCFEDPLDAAMMALLLRAIAPAQPHFVELRAPLEVRLLRNQTENRLLHKPSKRDLVASEARMRRNDARRFDAPGEVLPWAGPHMRLDNSELEPELVATRICERFGLPERVREKA